jgi:hypothetical protein
LPMSTAMDEKMMSLLNIAVAPKVSIDGAMQSYVYLSHYDIMTHSHFDTWHHNKISKACRAVFRNFGLFNFAGTFPELTENLVVSSAELTYRTNRDSRSSLPDPTCW